MPKTTVSDTITDQEIAFARLILSGTMNERCAAEAAALNPDTATYTKSKPRVRAYMTEHRAAVSERLVDQEVEGLRKLNLGRDQILARLWELARLPAAGPRPTCAGRKRGLIYGRPLASYRSILQAVSRRGNFLHVLRDQVEVAEQQQCDGDKV